MTVSPNYVLASSAGYKVNIGDEGYNPYVSSTLRNKSEFSDVIITRDNQFTDTYDLHTKALVSVNGFIHPTSFLDERLYVKKAVHSMLRTGYNHIGIISFQNLGQDLEKISITEEMIHKADDYPLYEKMLIELPKQLDGFILIYAGYIIVPNDQHLVQVGEKTYAFYPSRIGVMDRIYELARYYDIFKELDIEVSPNDDHVVEFSKLTSDEVMKNLLTRFNSFFVNFKGHRVDYKVTQLEHTAVPNNYRTEVLPSKPLIGGRGKLIEYKMLKYNRFKYTVLTVDAYMRNLANSYTPKYALQLINRNAIPADIYRLSSVMFLELLLTPFKYDK